MGVAQASIDTRKDTINDDNFLQAWGFLEFDGLNIKEKYQAEAILEKFALSNETWTEQKLKEVMERMEKFSECWQTLFNPSSYNNLTPQLKNLYERLCHIGLDKWEMSCIVGLGYCLSNGYEDKLATFLNLFEKYLFCHTYMYLGLSRDTSFLVGPVKELYKKKIELDNKACKNDYEKDVCKTLVDLAEKICGKQGSEKKDCLANILSTTNLNSWATKLAVSGFYNWNGISYFLFDKPNIPGAKEIKWREIADKKATIEHIFPQNPKEDWDGLFDAADCEIEQAKQALGNLLPLSFKTNEKVKNKNIHFKKRIYGQDSASAMKFCSDYDFWDLNNLIYRTDEQLQVIYDHWLNPDVILKNFVNMVGGTYDVTFTQADFNNCKQIIIDSILKKTSKVKLNSLTKHTLAKLRPALREKQKNLIVSLYRDHCKSYGSRINKGGNILLVIKTQEELNSLLVNPKSLSKTEKNAEKDRYNREADEVAENLGLSGYTKHTLVLPSDLLQNELCPDVVKALLPDFSQPAKIIVSAENKQIEKKIKKRIV